MINPWLILGVNRQSEDTEIQAAFHELARKHHPDLGGDKVKFQLANEAYQLLKDKKRRSIFIKDLIVRNSECKNCKGCGATFRQRGLTSRVATTCTVCGGAGLIIEGEKHVVVELSASCSPGKSERHYRRQRSTDKCNKH